MENILLKLKNLLQNSKSLSLFVAAAVIAYAIKLWISRKKAQKQERKIKNDSMKIIQQKWQDIAKGASLIQGTFHKYPQELIEELKKADLTALQKILRDPERMITSKDLVIVFGNLCYQEGKKNGWLMDEMFEEALQLAQQRDQERKDALKEGKTLSLLHGIPFSFKDHIRYKGTSTTWGHPSMIYPADTHTNIAIQMLMLDGAIPLVKSSLPIAPALSTHNLISGFAKNPYNPKRTSGGSSGGQGGLVGSGCTPFGIGSDMAGSIRVPAGWCGVAGLSPSAKRVAWGSSLGFFFENMKQPEGLIYPTLGPLAKSTNDIEAIMGSLCKNESFENHLSQVPMPFTSAKVSDHLSKKYRIGYYTTDGFIQPCGAIERAVLKAKDKLESQGHTLIHLKTINLTNLANILSESLWIDQVKAMARSMRRNEAKPSGVQKLVSLSRMSPFLLRLINWTLRKEPRVSIPSEKSGYQIMDLNIRFEEEVSKLYELLQEEGIEALLCPLHSVPAPSPSFFPYGIPINYTGVFNMVGFASGAIPFGFVTQEDAKEPYAGDGIEDTVTKGMRKTMQGSLGLPLAVQVASFPGRDELVVALMKQLEDRNEIILNMPIVPKI